jgi:uncharacterized protein YbjT (DUF2867 family)
MNNTTLVTGATGNVGAHVVRQLRARGEAVRAFVRDPDKAAATLPRDVDLAVGDFARPGSLRGALDGVDRLFLACGNVPGQVAYERDAVDVARAAGVRIVKLSTTRATLDSPLLYPRGHAEIERHLRASGVPATVLRPGFFMTNLLASADAVRATGRLFAPAGAARIAMIHPRDVAAVAAVVLAEDGHDGMTYELTGPAAITYADVAAALSTATARAVEFVDVPDDAARASMLEAGMPQELAGFIVMLFGALRGGLCAHTTDVVRALTGREPRGFAEFAREHAAAFGAVAASAVS